MTSVVAPDAAVGAQVEGLDFPGKGEGRGGRACAASLGDLPACQGKEDGAAKLAGDGQRASSARKLTDMRTGSRLACHLGMQADMQMVRGLGRRAAGLAGGSTVKQQSSQCGRWPSDQPTRLPDWCHCIRLLAQPAGRSVGQSSRPSDGQTCPLSARFPRSLLALHIVKRSARQTCIRPDMQTGKQAARQAARKPDGTRPALCCAAAPGDPNNSGKMKVCGLAPQPPAQPV